jgi:hypothetical protein
MAILTLAQVKEYLRIQTSNTEHDAFLDGSETVTGMISLVTQELEDAIGNEIESTERDVTFNGSGCAVQHLPYWPIISLYGGDEATRLANLQSRGSATEAWADLVTDEDYIYFDIDRPWAIVLLDGYTFPSGTNNIRAKYYSGFSTVPSDIVMAVLERVALKWMESKRGESRLGVSSMGQSGAGGQNLSYTDHQKRWDAVVRKYGRLI